MARSFSLALFVVGLLLTVGQRACPAQDVSEEVTLYRHHVVFLVDASGSVLGYPYVSPERFGALRELLRGKLPAILADPNATELGVPILDLDRDLTSAFIFGYRADRPLFMARDSEFLQPLWRQRPNHGGRQLAARLPRRSFHYTGLSLAFPMAVRASHRQGEGEKQQRSAFERTFLVMVTDERSNASKNSLDELRELHGAAVPNYPRSTLKVDQSAVASYLARLQNYYSLRAVKATDGAMSLSLGGRLRVLVRELVPHRLDGIDSLLAQRPERLTRLRRRAGERYEATLRLAPKLLQREEVGYQLVALAYRSPNQERYGPVSVPSSEKAALLPVTLLRGEIPQATASFRLTFVRHDPIYGQALQRFEETVRFAAEPHASILGIVSVPDWLMALLPMLDQEAVATVATYALIGLLLLFAYWLLFPAPRPEMEWAGELDGSPRTVPVDFSWVEAGGKDGGVSVLGAIRFTNTARRLRWIPGVGQLLGLLRAEQRFAVSAQVSLVAPSEVLVEESAVGISAAVKSGLMLTRLSQGAEVVVGLKPAAFQDYSGDWRQTARCKVRVSAQQPRRFGRSRTLSPLEAAVDLRFIPEAPGIAASLLPLVGDQPTGRTAEKAFPSAIGGRRVEPWLTVPHWRQEPGEEPVAQLALAVRSRAKRQCAEARNARLRLTLVRASDGEPLPGAVAPAQRELPGLERIEPSQGEVYWRFGDIVKVPKILPILFDFERIPTAGAEGDDYLLVAQLAPAEGQTWETEIVHHGVRIGPDPRRPEMALTIATGETSASGDLVWRAIEPPANGAEVPLAATQTQLSGLGGRQSVSTLVRLRLDNLARSGAGAVELELVPQVNLQVGQGQEEGFEPEYWEGRQGLLQVTVAGRVYPLAEITRPVVLKVASEASGQQRPLELALRFDPNAIRSFEPGLRQFRYQCRLPFLYRVAEGNDGEPVERSFALNLSFVVERHAGDYVMAVDFGTSALVAAFEQSLTNVETRNARGFSMATLDLQGRYADLLAQEEEGEEESLFPNAEQGTPFIPSHLVWNSEEPLGRSEFVHLPATVHRLLAEPDRAIHYLKALILRGERVLPAPSVALSSDGGCWLDRDGSPGSGAPPVDGVIESAYRNLLERYLLPLLTASGREPYLDQILLAHPNSFSLGHLARLRKVLESTFGERYRFDFLSESKAVALYCACPPERFLPPEVAQRDELRVLVYDIGAGTLDLTYARLRWASEEDGYGLAEMEVLYQCGVPVAGNCLDIALAKLLDGKIRHLRRELAAEGVRLGYDQPIVPEAGELPDPIAYGKKMLPLKRELHNLKVRASNRAAEGSFTLHLPVSASADTAQGLLSLDASSKTGELERTLDRLDLVRVKWGDRTHRKLGIPLMATEIFGHEEVEGWLARVTEEPIADLAAALKELAEEPVVDALLLSGRTSLFPPLKPRLQQALSTHLGLDTESLPVVELAAGERKEAVVLGCLHYALLLSEGVRFQDRSVWARYGLIYPTAKRGAQFREMFGFATRPDPQLGDRVVEAAGMSRTLFCRRATLPVTGQIEVAATYSSQPNRDLADRLRKADKFSILHTLSARELRQASRNGRVEIEMAIDLEGKLRVRIDPDGLAHEVADLAYRSEGERPEQEWPYRPPEGPPLELPARPQLVLAEKVDPLPAAEG